MRARVALIGSLPKTRATLSRTASLRAQREVTVQTDDMTTQTATPITATRVSQRRVCMHKSYDKTQATNSGVRLREKSCDVLAEPLDLIRS